MEIELTIISATALKAKDHNGYSDPYVNISSRNTTLKETKIIKKTLCPVWNETFKLTVEMNETLDITIFDHDKLSRDDFIGKRTIKIPRMYTNEVFVDTLSITNGGYLNYRLKCISGYDKTEIAKNLDKNSCQVIVIDVESLSKVKQNVVIPEKGRICIKGTNHTNELFCDVFDYKSSVKKPQQFYFKAKIGQSIFFQLQERKFGKWKTINETSYIIPDMFEGQCIEEHLPMINGGTLHGKITCVRSVYHYCDERIVPTLKNLCKGDEYVLVIEKAENIIKADKIGTSDGYVVFKTKNHPEEMKTHVIKNTLNPTWSSAFRITFDQDEEIVFNLFDWNAISKHVPIGKATFQMKSVNDINDNEWKQFVLDIDRQGRLFIKMKRVKDISEDYQKLLFGKQTGDVTNTTQNDEKNFESDEVIEETYHKEYHKMSRRPKLERMPAKTTFIDKEFDACDLSIGLIPSEDLKQIEWLRPSEFMQNPSLYSGKIEPADCILGHSYNSFLCSILTSLSLIPTRIRKMIEDKGNGEYVVTFHGIDEPIQVTVDDRIPCIDGEPCFMCGNGDEL